MTELVCSSKLQIYVLQIYFVLYSLIIHSVINLSHPVSPGLMHVEYLYFQKEKAHCSWRWRLSFIVKKKYSPLQPLANMKQKLAESSLCCPLRKVYEIHVRENSSDNQEWTILDTHEDKIKTTTHKIVKMRNKDSTK